MKLATKKPRKTDKVWAFGYPGVSDYGRFAQEATVTQGTVSQFQNGWRGSGTELEIIQHTAATNPGNSGGPLFDECDRVVGIHTRSYRGDVGRGTAFASRITEAIPHLEQQGIQLQKRHDACVLSGGVRVVVEQAAVIGGWISYIMGGILALVAIIALALRTPRQKIVKVVESAARISSEYVSSKIASGPRKPAGANGGNERAALVLAGFDTSGKKLRIPVPKHGAAAAQGGYVIGRHAALVDHVVEGTHISRRHARITVEHGQCRIEDLNSTNGTQVNGRRLKAFAPTPIAPGDRVLFGTVEVASLQWQIKGLPVRRRNKEINIFSMSALDLFASALGGFHPDRRGIVSVFPKHRPFIGVCCRFARVQDRVAQKISAGTGELGQQ